MSRISSGIASESLRQVGAQAVAGQQAVNQAAQGAGRSAQALAQMGTQRETASKQAKAEFQRTQATLQIEQGRMVSDMIRMVTESIQGGIQSYVDYSRYQQQREDARRMLDTLIGAQKAAQVQAKGAGTAAQKAAEVGLEFDAGAAARRAVRNVGPFPSGEEPEYMNYWNEIPAGGP
ncbi:MAG: hypothetical protein ACE5FA_00700 [Dehalococcoidia bacterium]